jgi:hypothetical protein
VTSMTVEEKEAQRELEIAFGSGIRNEGRRALALRLERKTKGRTHISMTWAADKETYTPHTLRIVPEPPRVKRPWSPEREACSIVAIFAQRGDDKVWRINIDHATQQERKAARAVIRFAGGKVGVK